ncbi:hypothetical protein FHT00_001119 [Sphingomonas insulae]|uniref:Uncharacterized protein n=1 Tax=Sphingomonas insulae TaxID=424800 RepID=A0ABN1HRH1_9SPHN|nr:DUF6628 family protein [Sphingomonas insulae]NIJ29186.1 hypothetical protein [Sphingomonas insulae]
MSDLTTTIAALPYALPACPNARIALFALRRMGAHGPHDARASHALFTAFGQDFRRPLVLMRALMADLAGTAEGTIAIAPCCCSRMTAAERSLLTILSRIETAPDSARYLLGDLLGVRRVDAVMASVAVLAMAFADDGRPICV